MTVVPFDYETHLEQCAARGRRAFKALYDTESGRMLGLATRMLNRRDEAKRSCTMLVQIWRITPPASTGRVRFGPGMDVQRAALPGAGSLAPARRGVRE